MKVKIMRKTLEGRPHLVVPSVLIVEGVLNGSNGPLFYPADELQKSVAHWNGRPVVVDHPDIRYAFAAGNPEVFDRQRVGTIFNTRFEGRALKADVWLDPERLALVDVRVLNAIKKGKVMEISTGLFTEWEAGSGTFNGKTYEGVARSYRPDHLAILPNLKGACSIADGAGLWRNRYAAEEPLLAPALVC